VSCGGDKNKNANANKNNSSKSTAKNIELSANDDADKTPSESNKTEETKQDTSPPMTKAQLSAAKDLIKKTSKDKVNAVDAAKVYKMRCASCHGFKGNMMVNGAKDLTISKVSLEESVAQVYFGKGLMTPFKGVMKDEEIIAVAQHIEKEIMK